MVESCISNWPICKNLEVSRWKVIIFIDLILIIQNGYPWTFIKFSDNQGVLCFRDF